jgi:hypothetical protein
MNEAASPAGQAAPARFARGCVRGVSFAFRVLVALLLLGSIALGALAWRLNQAPLPLPLLARLLEDAVNEGDQPTRVAIGGVLLAWADTGESDPPLELQVRDVVLADASGRQLAALPQAAVSLSLRALLLGRIAPRTVTLIGLDLRLLRAADGAVVLDLGSQSERFQSDPALPAAESDDPFIERLLPLLTGPSEGPFGRNQLQAAILRDARLAIIDSGMGKTWQVPDLDVTLRRGADGLMAEGAFSIAIGTEVARLAVSGAWHARSRTAEAMMRFAPLRPAMLAQLSPDLGQLGVLDAPISGRIEARFDADLRPLGGRATFGIGAGRIVPPGTAGIPIQAAEIAIDATPDAVRATTVRLVLDTRGAAPSATIEASGVLSLGDRPRLAVNASLARLDIADLARIWPEGLGLNERRWLVPNVTAGLVSDVAFAFEAELPADFSDVIPQRMLITGKAERATVHYLRPMPPAEDARGIFRIDLDAVDVTVEGGRVGRNVQGQGTVRLTDLATRPQYADIALDITAPVSDALALVQHPRLKLFEVRPMPAAIREATGLASARLTVKFPLWDALPVDAVAIAAEGRVSDARIPKLAAGQDLTEGRFAVSLGNDGLKLSGPARFASVPITVAYEQDFRSGPPGQVIERIRAEGRVEEQQLAALGVDTAGRLAGTLSTTVNLASRRNGQAEAAIRADLRDARLLLQEAGYEKPTGTQGSFEATLRLASERITALESIRIEAPELSARGRVGFTAGQPDRITISTLSIGRTRASGEVLLGRDGGISVTARGAVLDASPLFAPSTAPASPPPPAATPAESVLRLDLGFERVLLANNRTAEGVSLRLERRGERIEQLAAAGRLAGAAAFEATVARRAASRTVAVRAADAGQLLSALDVIPNMEGGRLALDGSFEEPGNLLRGTAEIEEFRLRDAPAIGRLLQGMTLYGLLDLARGPGLNFSRLTAPFTFGDGVLTLADARAFSPSLGLTAKGRIDTGAKHMDLEGTVVPAYFFNSLLGNIPLIGRMFSPERGGGVFAATYSARGPMSDPQVSVNPLAALTPGFLRGMFGIFESAPAPAAAPAAPTPGNSPSAAPPASVPSPPARMAPLDPDQGSRPG